MIILGQKGPTCAMSTVGKKRYVSAFSLCGSVRYQAGKRVCLNIMKPIQDNGSAFVGHFVSILILPGVASRRTGRQAISRLPRSTSKGDVVAARPGFIPGRTTRVRLTGSIDILIHLVSYINCVIRKTTNRVRGKTRHLIGAP